MLPQIEKGAAEGILAWHPDRLARNSVDGGKIVGVTNVRHFLNENIEFCGGHIGLGIRPSCRGRGLGNYLMQLSIEYLVKMGSQKIHIHCYKENESSARTIINNGGVLVSEFVDNQKVIQQCLEAGASAYVSKPFDFDNVLKIINDTISK